MKWRGEPEAHPADALGVLVQSNPHLIEFPRDVKHWLSEGPPPVDAARPSRCTICRSASRDDRRGLTLYGHGLRGRAQWGPPAPSQLGFRLVVATRRYQCQLCDAVLVVVPRGMLPRKRYSGSAIAFAMALWALARLREPEVFERVSVFELSVYVEVHGWRSLRRWTHDAIAGGLWPRVRGASAGNTYREHAERIAVTLTSFAPDPLVGSLCARAFEGAKHVGRG
jgi:hypothetical protein